MTTNNYTPIATGESNAPATINTRLATIDAAIGNLGGLTTSNKGSTVAAINELDSELSTEAAARAAADTALTNTIAGLGVEAGNANAEVTAARQAGNTDGNTASLTARVATAAAGAYHPMDYSANGDGSTNDYTALNAIKTAIGSDEAYIIIDRAYALGTSLTLPANVHVEIVRGGQINVATGVTLTINGSINAGPYQVFSLAGTGSVLFGAGGQGWAHAEWFGMANDATGESTNAAALQAVVNALQHGGKIRFGAGTYLFASTVYIYGAETDTTHIFEGTGYQTIIGTTSNSDFTMFKLNLNSGGSQVFAVPQQPMAIWRDMQVDAVTGTGAITFCEFDRASPQLYNVFFDGLYEGLVGDDYCDKILIDNVRWRQPQSNGVDYGWCLRHQDYGDGFIARQCHFNINGIYMQTLSGGVIDSCIGGVYRFDKAASVTMTGNHWENGNVSGHASAIVHIKEGQNILLENNWIQHLSVTTPTILIEETASSTNARRSVILRNNIFSKSNIGDDEIHDIDVQWLSSADDSAGHNVYGRLLLENNFVYIWEAGRWIFDVKGIRCASANTTIDALFDDYRNYLSAKCEIWYDGPNGWSLRGTLPDGREVNTITGYRSYKSQSQPTIATAAESGSYTGSIANGTTYYYKLAFIDGAQTTTASSEKSATTTADDRSIVLQVNSVPVGYTARFWRGTSTGTYTAYADIDLWPAGITQVFDTGDNIMGQAWVTSGVPSTPASNTTVTQTLTDDVLQYAQVTPTDDSVVSFTPDTSSGIIAIQSYSNSNVAAMIHYRTGAGAFCSIMGQPGTAVQASTSTLTGTTGTDGYLTVSATGGGGIYIENRTGATQAIAYSILSRR